MLSHEEILAVMVTLISGFLGVIWILLWAIIRDLRNDVKQLTVTVIELKVELARISGGEKV